MLRGDRVGPGTRAVGEQVASRLAEIDADAVADAQRDAILAAVGDIERGNLLARRLDAELGAGIDRGLDPLAGNELALEAGGAVAQKLLREDVLETLAFELVALGLHPGVRVPGHVARCRRRTCCGLRLAHSLNRLPLQGVEMSMRTSVVAVSEASMSAGRSR